MRPKLVPFAAALLLLGATTPALAATRTVIPDGGVRIEPGPASDLCREARIAADAGFEWVSTGVYWEAMEPTPGASGMSGSAAARQWDTVEQFLACTKSLGLKTLVVVTDAPSWASGRAGVSDDYPTVASTGAYGAFLGALATRYGAYVDAWTPWNEPNFDLFWRRPHDPVRYVQMQKVAYSAIKAADPTAMVTSAPIVGSAGGAATSAWDYARDMFAAGLVGSYDVFAFNFYPRQTPEAVVSDSRGRPAPWALSSQTYLRTLLDSYDPGRPIWITEVGNSTCVSCNASSQNALSETAQADYLVRTYVYRRAHLASTTDRIFVFNLRDLTTSRSDWLSNMGLLHFDLSPKPAFTALSALRTGSVEVPTVPPSPPLVPTAPSTSTGTTETTTPSTAALTSTPSTPAPTPTPAVGAGVAPLLLSVPSVATSSRRVTIVVRASLRQGVGVVQIDASVDRKRWTRLGSTTFTSATSRRYAFPNRGYRALRVRLRPSGAATWARTRVVNVARTAGTD